MQYRAAVAVKVFVFDFTLLHLYACLRVFCCFVLFVFFIFWVIFIYCIPYIIFLLDTLISLRFRLN